MRLLPVFGAAALALSAAALAQVASTPVEQKVPTGDERAPGAEVLANDSDAEAPANDSAANTTAENVTVDDAAALNSAAAGDPVEASTKPPRD